jgi:hypothetical protein
VTGRDGAASAFVVPDLTEPLLGWRSWRVVERPAGAFRLASVVKSVEWPARRALTATCVASHARLVLRRCAGGGHRSPSASCVCGIYAASSVAAAISYLDTSEHSRRGSLPRVLGVVKLWGTVLECERGLRGATAYPARLFVVSARRRRAADPLRVAAGLAVYGVPVEVLELGDSSIADLLVARDQRVEFETPRLPWGN